MSELDTVRIGLVSISDRASSGVYDDQGIPALQASTTRTGVVSTRPTTSFLESTRCKIKMAMT